MEKIFLFLTFFFYCKPSHWRPDIPKRYLVMASEIDFYDRKNPDLYEADEYSGGLAAGFEALNNFLIQIN